jgi:tryptophan 2,3-dioxygenase
MSAALTTGASPSYRAIVRLDELLELPREHAENGDELLFFTIHQASELWFQVILDHLEDVRRSMQGGDLHRAARYLRRVVAIETSLADQLTILSMIGPAAFARLRGRLGSASALQSAQFRLIEFVSGRKDPRYLRVVDSSPRQMAELQRCLSEPSLNEVFMDVLRTRGADLPSVYAGPERYPELFALAEVLVDHDETFSIWRTRHFNLAARMIGGVTGTGGTSGLPYLERALNERFFPELWAARSEIVQGAGQLATEGA